MKFICKRCKEKLSKHPNCICKQKITTINKWLESYGNNNNTGVNEEKKTGLALLLRADLDTHINLPNEYKDLKSEPKISGVIGLLNLTQSDNIGGTGDIGILYDRNIEYFSVTQGNGSKPVKCISNPSASAWYNFGPRTVEIDKMNEKAYNLAVEYRRENYGDTPNKKWKRLKDCPGAKMMTEYLAKMGSTSWNTMDKGDKIKSLHKFLDIDTKLKSHADGIIYWNNKKKCIDHIYKWELNINIEDYLDTYNNGIYIYHGKPDNYILKTQAKYNNGIIEGMSSKVNHDQWDIKKSTSYLSSWDVVAPDLTKIFKMTTITLDK